MKLSKLTVAVTALVYSGYGAAALAADPEVLRTIDQNQTGAATTCLVMTQSMETEGNTPKVLANYVSALNKTTGRVQEVNLFTSGRNLCLSDLDFGTEYKVTLKAGLRDSTNAKLSHDTSVEFKTIDHQPSIRFQAGNIISAAEKDKKVAVESINHDKFRAVLYRISSMDLAAYTSRATSDLDYRWSTVDYIRDHGTFLGTKVYKVEGGENTTVTTFVDLKDLSAKQEPGTYVLFITGTDTTECDAEGDCLDYITDHYESMFMAKSLVISNIGMTTYQKDTGIDIAVRALNSAKPMAGARATLISSSNEVLATAVTDKNGYAHFGREAVKGVNSQKPVIVNVTKDGDFYSQDLRLMPLVLEGVRTTDTSGTDSDYNVFAYTDRTMVRPGEKVNYHAIVRDRKLNATSVKALKLMVYRPDGLLYQELTLSNPAAGAFDYDFDFDEYSQNGSWKFVLGFDKKHTLSTTSVLVDDFIPSSIEPSIIRKGPVLKVGDSVIISTRFTYDAPAPGISVSGYYTIEPDNHPVDAYKDYYFGPNQRKVSELTVYGNIPELETDNTGAVTITLDSEGVLDDYAQKVKSSYGFTDPNSKVLNKKDEFKIYFKSPLVGVKTDFDKNDSMMTDFGVILADQSGNLHKGKVDYSIYKRHISYQFVYNNDSWNYLRNEHLTPVTAGSLDLKEDTSGRIRYRLESGSYVIKLNYNGLETSSDFYAGSCSDIDPKYPDRFELFADKTAYKAGETAYLEFDSSYDGFADLVVDTPDSSMTHYEIRKGHNRLPVKLSDSFVRGSYAVLSTYASAENRYLGSLRSIGVAYLEADKSADTLKISADIPQKVVPNSGVDIVVKVDNADSNTYVAASFIDKGILSINGQKAPEPEKKLYNHRYFNTDIYDPYSYIMKSVSHKGQGYGDESGDINMMAGMTLSNITDNLMSYHLPRVKVENGEAKLHYDLKDVSSTASLMVTAWSADKLGSYSVDVPVKDSAVSRMVMPYYLHLGDTMEAQLTINNLSGRSGTYTYSVTCSGGIKCDSKGSVSAENNSLASVPVQIEATGSEDGHVSLSVKSDGYDFATEREIKVINPMSRIAENRIVVLKAGQKADVSFVNAYRDGTDVVAKLGKFPLSDTSEMVKDILADDTMFGNIYKQSANGMTLLSVLNTMEKNSAADSRELREIKKSISDRVSLVESRFDTYGSLLNVSYSYEESCYAYAYASLFLIEANNAGFGVNRNMLAIIRNKLSDLQTAESHNTAALAMYALARMGVNVKTNAIYRFDSLENSSNYQIEAFAYYADIFGLYGDRNRRTRALEKGISSLNNVVNTYNVTSKNVHVYDSVELYKKLLVHFPYVINNVRHEVLALIRSSVRAGYSEGLDGLYGYLSEDTYFDPSCQYLIADISGVNRTPASTVKLKVKGNAVSVENPSSETAVSTVSVNDYVVKAPVTGDSIRLTTRYYDSNGKEITGPVTLKVNEEILVVNELTSKTKFSGLITVENKIPANAVLLKVYSGDDEKLLKGIISGSLGYQEVSKGDTGFVSSVTAYNTNAITVAYTIKAAHRGVSVPLMNSAYLDRIGTKMFVSYNENASITVK
ncbi:alpha-2-macroglobulin [Ruminobacter sp. RM87]|uniref:alpha-2-macroglobulin family protein n=1 Tax=Ruminobacter sp. RM87 TaxID=1200567 RepID=UPI0004E12238|nr:MG2 domain-containing protein [Ruminobacter sp. RM87]